MRVFIAIPLNSKTRQKLSNIKTKYQKIFLQKVAWVEPENFHLTLKFIGEINSKQLEILDKILNNFKKSLIKKNFYLTKTNLMPINKPKIIYVEIESNYLIKVMKKIDQILFKFSTNNNSKYYNYKPHITLGRIKSSLNKSDKLDMKKIEKYKINLQEKFNCFILFESINISSKTIYKPLKKYLL